MADDLDRIAQRTFRYWYEDGIAEAATGAFFILMGLYSLGCRYFTQPPWRELWSLGMMLLIVGGAIAMRRLIRAAKNRVTYPRTGYVEYRRTRATWRCILPAAVGVAVAAIGVLTAKGVVPVHGITYLIVAAVSASLILQAVSFGLARLAAVAAGAAAAGITALLAGLDMNAAHAVYFSAVGLGSLLSGLLVLGSYLRRTGPSTGQEEE